jgi:hypothetical protein
MSDTFLLFNLIKFHYPIKLIFLELFFLSNLKTVDFFAFKKTRIFPKILKENTYFNLFFKNKCIFSMSLEQLLFL